jgi:uncharacterized protein
MIPLMSINKLLDNDPALKRDALDTKRGNKPFDLRKAAMNLRRRAREKSAQRRRLFEKADAQCKRIVTMAIAKYKPRRIYVWGSLLRPGRFDENSDIDIAVEGVEPAEKFFALAGDALNMAAFPLDLVELDKIDPLDRQTIITKGKLVYERPDGIGIPQR